MPFTRSSLGSGSPQFRRGSGDVGTITIRYVVLAQGESRTHLRIDAVFVEDGHRKADHSRCHRRIKRIQGIRNGSGNSVADRNRLLYLRKRQEEDESQAALLPSAPGRNRKLEPLNRH